MLKYPQISGSSRGRVSTSVLAYFVYVVYGWSLTVVVITACHWQGSYACRSTCTKSRKDLRFILFLLIKIMKFGVLMSLTLGGQKF